ncbi:MAG: hypothetical protein U0176_21465 [Bacteroidia bacterium]
MRKRLICLMAVFLFCGIGHDAFAQLSYLTSTMGGSSYEVCLQGNHLYVGAANTLVTFPIIGPNHTPGAPTDSIRLRSNIDQIIEHNGFLYVCANHDGLYKFDLTNPAKPIAVAHFIPNSRNESIYDIAFRGDSLIVAAKHKLQYLRDSGSSITFIADIFSTTGDERIHGVDLRGNLIAFTVGFSKTPAPDEGVYLFDANTFLQVGFYNESEGDAWDVYFGQSTPLLHVMGGNDVGTFNGLYYVLDYTNPASLQLALKDTLLGFIPSMAMPMSAKLIHDTIYIATQGAVKNVPFPPNLDGYVFVYDATSPSNVHYIEDINAGLYHFDIDIDPSTSVMYVASEWYGVLAVDIYDIHNEVRLDQKLTGGWCHGSAFAKDRLAQASEGFGMQLYDMSVRQNPILIAEDTAIGFCRAISMDDSARYVFGWYLTNEKLRVFDARNGTLLGSISGPPFEAIEDDWQKARQKGNRIAVIQDPTLPDLNITKRIYLADISNPTQPSILKIKTKSYLRDLLFLPSGELVALAHDSIIVLNPNDLTTIHSVAPQFILLQRFKAMALSGDTLSVFMEGYNEGILKYYVNPSTHHLTFVNASSFPLNVTIDERVFMATDDTVLYISSSLDSLKAVDLHAPHAQLAVYDHSADFVWDHLWGVHDLYYSQGLLVLNEYMGQTSIFGAPTMVAIPEEMPQLQVRCHPNPTSGSFVVDWDGGFPMHVRAYDLGGRLRGEWPVMRPHAVLDASGWPDGLYVLQWAGAQKSGTTKLVIQSGRR